MKKYFILMALTLFITKMSYANKNTGENEPPLPTIENAEYFTNMDKDREDFVANGHYYFCMNVQNARIEDFIIYKNEKLIPHSYNGDYLIFCLGPIKSTDFLTDDFFVQYVFKPAKSGKVKISRKLYLLSYYPGYEKLEKSQSFLVSSYY